MDLEQLEALALAPAAERETQLSRLIPGSESYYLHSCLAQLQRGAFEAVDALMKAWTLRHGETQELRAIRDRRALLSYEQNPERAREHLRRRFGLSFDHTREQEGDPAGRAARLDPSAVDRAAFRRDASHQREHLDGFDDRALDWLAEDPELSLPQLRALLSRIRRPDYAGLVELVARELDDRHSGGFGSLEVHTLMTSAQLDALAQARPAVRGEPRFVEVCLSRLQPGPDFDLALALAPQSDPGPEVDEALAYLETLATYVSGLPRAFASLAAHVLFHRLDFDRRHARFDAARFERYIALPRDSRTASEAVRKRHHSELADLHEDFSASTGLPSVGDDTALIRDYLAHLSSAPGASHEDYAASLDADFLRREFAQTKILAGVGDRERWYSLLDDPVAYAALEARVDIDLAIQNPTFFAAGAPVELLVDIKNVSALVVKVFEINALAYFLSHQKAVTTAVDLDGLVANDERVVDCDSPPLHRVRRTIAIAGLDEAGTYVVELIGNGKSSRALIQKGGLRYLERQGAAGHVLTVLDEADTLVSDATAYFGGRAYEADARAEIRLPYGSEASHAQLLLRRGRSCSVLPFALAAERYELRAGIHVEREQLLPGAQALLLVRASLSVNGVPIAPRLLREAKLTVTSLDRHGTSSSVTAAITLNPEGEAVHTIEVPEALRKLSFEVRGEVRGLTTQRDIELHDGGSIELNAIDLQAEVAALHLAHTAAGYILYVLGKSGEPRPNMQVNLSLTHRDFRAGRLAPLRSDDDGRVELGELPEIDVIEASLANGAPARWVLRRAGVRLPRSLHAAAGSDIVLPYPTLDLTHVRGSRPAALVSLLERRGTGYLRDCIDAVSLEPGGLRISGLEPGDYRLEFKAEAHVSTLRVGPETVALGWALSARRQLQLRPPEALRITRLELGTPSDDGVTPLEIQIEGAGPDARIHVFASRFVPPYDPRATLDVVRLPEPGVVAVSRGRSRYLSGRDIGDEYRYILERKRAQRFPGNMLARPGLLLNPWAIRKTATGVDSADKGSSFGGGGGGGASTGYACMAAPAPASQPSAAAPSTNLDFLPEPAYVALNLRPDETGALTLPGAAFGHANTIEVVLVDGGAVVSRTLPLPEVEAAPRDLRLRDALPPATHFVRRKRRTVLDSGQTLHVEDIRTAKLEAVDSLAKAHALLSTLSGDPQLREFEFVTRWPSLDPARQRTLYSKYACHELNLFLARKDPDFFAAVVDPYLRNKRDKTFLDHYLVGGALAPYLEPWAFSQLNALERILLAQALANPNRSAIVRHIDDRCDLIAPDVEAENAAFDTALQGSALDSGDQFGLREAAQTLDEMVGGAAPELPAPAMAMAGAGPGSERARGGPTSRPRRSARKKSKAASASTDLRELSVEEGAFEDDIDARSGVRRLFRGLDTTQEWAENNYYQRRIHDQGPELITVGSFWRDLAQHCAAGSPGPFLSANFVCATRNFAEMMCALAVLDLPFSPEPAEVEFEGPGMSLRALTPTVLFHRQISPVSEEPRDLGLLVSQSYFREDDRFRWEDDECHDKYVDGEFLVHTVYLCQVVLTNPSSSAHKLDLLLQIPRGAMPLLDGFQTRDLHLHLEPRGTHSIEYGFYFPSPGEFEHFPVHVAKNEALVASAAPSLLHVVSELSVVDTRSWSHVSQHGSEAEVLAFLDTHNIDRLDLSRIAWRMRDQKFYAGTLDLLRARHVYSDLLWSFALHHDDRPALVEYLRHRDDFLRAAAQGLSAAGLGTQAQTSASLDTSVAAQLDLDPTTRRWYEHLEYAPLVHARAHPLGAERKVLNDGLRHQYRSFLEHLTYLPEPGREDLLAAAYYALLQDRIADGLALIARVEAAPGEPTPKLQYDYLRAYAALYRGGLDTARALAQPHTTHPVDRWRERFAALISVLDEAAGAAAEPQNPDDRDQAHTQLASTEPSLEFDVHEGVVVVRGHNLERCTLSLYRMDIELLFSRQPFVQDQSERFAVVAPNHSQTLAFPAGQSELRVPLPEAYRSANVIVELRGAGLRRSRAHYAHGANVRVLEQYGQLRVGRRAAGGPLPCAYVKVFARMHDGQVQFYKDGYTDLRGAFDFATLSTDQLDHVERFAILIATEEHGALIREAAPPQR